MITPNTTQLWPQLVIALPRLESSGSWCIPTPKIFNPRLRASVSSPASKTVSPSQADIRSKTTSPARSSDQRALANSR